MPRSKRTLSGCLESTLASGLLTFLLVQAVVSASIAARAITGVRRDMKTSNQELDCHSESARRTRVDEEPALLPGAPSFSRSLREGGDFDFPPRRANGQLRGK